MAVVFNLRKALKRRMELRGITAADLARQTGIAKQVLSDWLAGAMPRGLCQVKLVANALGTTVDELCFGDDCAGNEDVSEDVGGALQPDGQWIVGVFEGRIRVVEDQRGGVKAEDSGSQLRAAERVGDSEGVD